MEILIVVLSIVLPMVGLFITLFVFINNSNKSLFESLNSINSSLTKEIRELKDNHIHSLELSHKDLDGRVKVISNDMEWVKKSLDRIESKLGSNIGNYKEF